MDSKKILCFKILTKKFRELPGSSYVKKLNENLNKNHVKLSVIFVFISNKRYRAEGETAVDFHSLPISLPQKKNFRS